MSQMVTQKIIRSVLVLLLSIAGVFSLAPAASASDHGCTPGYVCLYRHEGYSGGQIDFQKYIPDLSLHTFEGTSIAGHAQVSSTINLGTYYNACLFTGKNGNGQSLELARTNHTYNLSRYYFNDRAYSAYFKSYTLNWMTCHLINEK
jgi:hypothetical protein